MTLQSGIWASHRPPLQWSRVETEGRGPHTYDSHKLPPSQRLLALALSKLRCVVRSIRYGLFQVMCVPSEKLSNPFKNSTESPTRPSRVVQFSKRKISKGFSYVGWSGNTAREAPNIWLASPIQDTEIDIRP